MERKDRDKDIAERRANYQAGLTRLIHAMREFEELTGINLLADVDTSGRHMGEAPYLKITAERLEQVTALIEGDVEEASETVGVLAAVVTGEAKILEFSAYRPGRP